MRVVVVLVVVATAAIACTDRPASPVTSTQSLVGPEFGTNVTPTRIRAVGAQSEASVACDDGGTCLAVYHDAGALVANRVAAASGTVIDLDATIIASAVSGHSALNPAVAFGDGQYLAVWSRFGSSSNYDLVGIRIGADGVAVDAMPFVISAGPTAEIDADVAWAGGVFFVSWTTDLLNDDTTDDARVYGALVDADGVASAPLELSPTTTDGAVSTAVATDGTSFLVAWSELAADGTWDIRGGRFDTAGAPVGALFGIATGNTDNDRDPDLAFRAGEYLAVWVDDFDGQGTKGVYMRRLALDGTGLGPARTTVAASVEPELEPVVSTDGATFLVAYQRDHDSVSRDVWANTVSSTGTAGTPFVVAAFDRNQNDVDVASGGSGFLVVFVDDNHYTSRDVIGARVSAGGALQDPAGFPIATSVSAEFAPVGASGPTGSVFVWTENRVDGINRSYLRRVDASGNLMDLAPIPLPGVEWKDSIQIAWASGVWLIVFREGDFSSFHRVYGVRIAEDGTVLDPVPFSLASASGMEAIALASDGTSFFLYLDYTNSERTRRVYADGTMSSVSASLPFDALGPASLGWDGSKYLLITRYNELVARRFTADGVLLDPTGSIVTDNVPPSFNGLYASIASDGTDWMVFFQTLDAGMQVRRVHDDGTMEPASTVESGPGQRQHPRIAFDGTHYAVGFDLYDPAVLHWSRRYLWLASDGTSYPGVPGTLGDDALAQGFGSLSSNGDGTVLATYERERADGHPEVHGRYVSCDDCVLPPAPDAGVPVDATPLDAAAPDAEPIDATIVDAAPPATDALEATDAKAPVAPDAERLPPPDVDAPGGCGCGVTPTPDALPIVLMVMLLARRRRRSTILLDALLAPAVGLADDHARRGLRRRRRRRPRR